MARTSCVLWLLTLSSRHRSFAGAMGEPVRTCNLESFPVQSLARHAESGAIFIVENNRLLKAARTEGIRKSHDAAPATSPESVSRNSFRRSLLGWANRNYTLISKVRQFTCPQTSPQDAYCPSKKNTCGLTADGSITCFTVSPPLNFLQNCWPIVMMWYIVILLFIFFTEQGRNSRQYMLACFCNNRLNTELVNEVLDRHRVHQRRSSSRIAHRSREDHNQNDVPALDDSPSDEDEARRPQRLTLKTKRFCRPCDAVDNEDADYCTICFVALQDGDRVGALPCQHSFHVDCLKLWIRRKNSCPLCQIPNVATPLQNDSNAQPYPSDRRDRPRFSLEVTREPAPGPILGQPFAGRAILNRIRR